jgi:hypothetical protein
MDVGRKCLLLAVLGALLTIFSSPFITFMLLNGRPFTSIVGKDVLNEVKNVWGPFHMTVRGTERVTEFSLDPGGKLQYRVALNVETNGTINVSVSKRDGSDTILDAFNEGNHTKELQIGGAGVYVLNVTSTGNKTVGATFKITESWFIEAKEWEEQLDALRTFGSSAAFISGIIMLAYALVELRRAVKTAYSSTSEGQAAYVEVEEE